MKRFKFSLQPILNLDEQKLRLEKEKLASILTKYEKEKSILKGIYVELNKILKENDDKTKEGIKVCEVIQSDLYKEMLYKKIIEQKNIIKETEKDILKIRERLIDISKNKEALANLKDKKKIEYKYIGSLEQAVIVDELLSYKVSKNIIGG